MSRFETVGDAVQAGRSHLDVRCQPCRLLKQVPWGLLPGLLSCDRIADLHQRLICSRCGTRPEPADVAVSEPPETPSGAPFGTAS